MLLDVLLDLTNRRYQATHTPEARPVTDAKPFDHDGDTVELPLPGASHPPAIAGQSPGSASGTTPPELELVRSWEILAALLRVRALDAAARGPLTRGERETLAAGEALCAKVREGVAFVL